jgi:phage gp36-like protein
MTLISPVYCTEAEMNRFMSAAAIIDFADHDDDGTADTDVVDDCINQATEEIDMYATTQYEQTALATSTLINRWCVIMAVRILCTRRGNPVPDSLETEWNRITDPVTGLLRKISQNLLQIPGISKRADFRPTFSNVKVDRRWRHSTIRVTPTNSSDAPTTMTQDLVVEHPALWD